MTRLRKHEVPQPLHVAWFACGAFFVRRGRDGATQEAKRMARQYLCCDNKANGARRCTFVVVRYEPVMETIALAAPDPA